MQYLYMGKNDADAYWLNSLSLFLIDCEHSGWFKGKEWNGGIPDDLLCHIYGTAQSKQSKTPERWRNFF